MTPNFDVPFCTVNLDWANWLNHADILVGTH